MRHEKRIVQAFTANAIQKILLIDDGYDAPALGGDIPGELIDFLESRDGLAACLEAGLSHEEVEAANLAANEGDRDAEMLTNVNNRLYARFVATREARFDPGGRFQTIKGATLDVLGPLADLLGKCGEQVDLRFAGIENGQAVYLDQKPQVVFLDFYLSADVAVGGDRSPKKLTSARKQSVDLLDRLLNATGKGEHPAIVLMSSEAVKKKAEQFREEVEGRGRDVIALRFRFLQKGWVKREGGVLRIEHDAADTLLDTSQGYVFGQVLQRALGKWRDGADKAMDALLRELRGLEPKDFAYLFRFRLVDEGERMSDYLEWMFGESLRALVDENVEWGSEDYKKLDDPDLSKGIEGAFDGPSTRIAKIFHRIRIQEHNSRPQQRRALGDIFVAQKEKSIRTVITPDCDLVPRKGKTNVENLVTMGGELCSFSQATASTDQFIFRNNRPYSIKWNPKDLQTFPVKGKGSLGSDDSYKYAGTLRPLYAQDMQRKALSDLSRVGLSVSPAMGVDSKVTAWLRKKNGKGLAFEQLQVKSESIATIVLERADAQKGHKVLLRRKYVYALMDQLRDIKADELEQADAQKLAELLKEKNENILISGFLTDGSLTKDKGPLGTKIIIAQKPDSKQDAPWLQLLLSLSEDAMEELLTVDPRLEAAAEPQAAAAVEE